MFDEKLFLFCNDYLKNNPPMPFVAAFYSVDIDPPLQFYIYQSEQSVRLVETMNAVGHLHDRIPLEDFNYEKLKAGDNIVTKAGKVAVGHCLKQYELHLIKVNRDESIDDLMTPELQIIDYIRATTSTI